MMVTAVSMKMAIHLNTIQTVIGAGAVVTKDVPAGEIWAGVPAKKIGVRDFMREQYRAAYAIELAWGTQI